MTLEKFSTFTWHGEVSYHEIDTQQIVHNARYSEYFDCCRTKHLLDRGVSLIDWHNKGIDIVVYSTHVSFKDSLREDDVFSIKSNLLKEGHLKILFEQTITREKDNKIVTRASTTMVCISRDTNKVVMPSEISSLLF